MTSRLMISCQGGLLVLAFAAGVHSTAFGADEGVARPAARPRLVVQVGHRTEVTAIGYSHDGKFIATGDVNGRIFLWDRGTGKQLRELKLPMPQSAVDPSGRKWASEHSFCVMSIGFSPDGALVAAGVRERHEKASDLHLWEADTGKYVSQGDDRLEGPWGFTADSQQLIAGNKHLIRNAEETTFAARNDLVARQLGTDDDVLALAIGKTWVAQGDNAGKVIVYGLNTLKAKQRLVLTSKGELTRFVLPNPVPGEAITVLALGGQDTTLLVGGRCGSIAAYDLQANKVLWNVQLRDPVERLSAAAGSRWIVARTSHRFVVLSTTDGKSVQQFDTNRAALCSCFSADGSRLLTGHGDTVLRLWDPKSGKLMRRFEGAFGAIFDAAIVEQASLVAAFDVYGVLSVWNVADGALVRQTKVHEFVERAKTEPAGDDVSRQSLAAFHVLQDSQGLEPYGLGLELYRKSRAQSWGYADAPNAKFCNQGRTLLYCGRSGSEGKGLLDVATGQKLAFPPKGFEPHNILAVSADGRFLVSDKMGPPDAYGTSSNSEYWLAALVSGKYYKKIAENGNFAGPTIAAISPDNTWVAIDDGGSNIRIVGASNGRVYSSIKTDGVLALEFSPRSTQLATAARDGIAQLWDRASGKLVKSLTGHSMDVTSISYSPDGKQVVTTSADETVRLWSVETGRQMFELQESEPTLAGLELLPDGNLLLIDRAGAATVRRSPDGEAISKRQLVQANERVDSVCLAESSLVLNARGRGADQGLGPRLTIHSLDERKPALVMQDSSKATTTYGQIAAFARGGSQIVAPSRGGVVRFWNEHGQPGRRKLEGAAGLESGTQMLMFSRDRRFVAAVNEFAASESARIWELASGKLIQQNAELPEWFSSFGGLKFAFRIHADGTTVDVVDVKTKRVLKRVADLHGGDLSADGRWLAIGQPDGTVQICDTTSMKSVRSFKVLIGKQAAENTEKSKGDSLLDLLGALAGNTPNKQPPEPAKQKDTSTNLISVFFSPTGRCLRTYDGRTHKIWDRATGKEQCELQWPQAPLEPGEEPAEENATLNISDVEFSPDERWIVGTPGPYLGDVPQQGHVVVWDAMTGKTTRVIRAPAASSVQPSFSADGRLILQSGADDAIYLWDRESGNLACQLTMIDDENWAVVDSDGRFDAANGGDIAGLHWVVGNEPITLNQLKARFYDPGLLAKILGFDRRARRPVDPLNKVALFPEVVATAPVDGQSELMLELFNRGGGIGAVQILVNGKELMADARGPRTDPAARQATIAVDLSGAHVVPGKPNQIKVVAWNAEGYLFSRGMDIEWVPEGKKPEEPQEFYAIVSGVSDYAAANLHLRFAAKDAEVMARSLKVAAERLFGEDHVHLTLLSTIEGPDATPPTKENLRQAFTAARKARPGDVLVVYLAGHGVAFHREQDVYCYLTQDARGTDTAALADPAVLETSAVTSSELVDWIKQIPALKQVMFLDTCAAGAAEHKLMERRDFSGDQERALDRLKDRTGFHVLMGCAADRASYEASQYAQGVLTYALLQGMKGAALREGEYVDISQLFQHAVEHVPQLARNIGGIQEPKVMAMSGSSFDVGRLTQVDRAAIPLAQIKPILLRPLLSNSADGDDNLRLLPRLCKRLNDASYSSSRGAAGEPTLVYVDADDLPGAIRPVGQYTVKASKVSVRLLIKRDGQTLDTLSVEGKETDLDALVANLAESITKAIKH